MTRVFSVPGRLASAIRLPVLLPLRLARNWLRGRVGRGLPGPVWTKANLQVAVHEVALFLWPPAAAVGAWLLYTASGWGPGGAGGDIRGAVLAWLAAGLVVLAVHGARRGDAVGGADEPDVLAEPEHRVPEHPLRYAAGYAMVFSLYLIVVLTLVLLPVALILSV